MFEVTVNDRTVCHTNHRAKAIRAYRNRVNHDGRRGRTVSLFRNGIERRTWDGPMVSARMREMVGTA